MLHFVPALRNSPGERRVLNAFYMSRIAETFRLPIYSIGPRELGVDVTPVDRLRGSASAILVSIVKP